MKTRQTQWLLMLVLAAGCQVGQEQLSGDTSPARSVVGEQPPGADLTKCGIALERGASGAWDGGMVEAPGVWYDSTELRYGMVYAGYDLRHSDRQGYGSVGHPQIGLAWSDDLVHWEKDPRNPILTPNGDPNAPDAAGASGPFMWQEDGTYYLFYFGTTEAGYEGGHKSMNLATSTNLETWTRYEGNPIIEPEGDGWRSGAIWHPNIVKVDSLYYLFFNASGFVDGHYEEFAGYATSPDLYTWAVDDANSPVLVGSRVPGAWDASGRIGDPSPYRVGDTWYMAYYSWDGTNAQDGLAMTSVEDFPLGWTPYDGNPILRLGAPGSFDGKHAHKPFIFRTEERHHHFYTAVDTAETREIAVAVEPGPCP